MHSASAATATVRFRRTSSATSSDSCRLVLLITVVSLHAGRPFRHFARRLIPRCRIYWHRRIRYASSARKIHQSARFALIFKGFLVGTRSAVSVLCYLFRLNIRMNRMRSMRLAARRVEDTRRRNPPVAREEASDPMTPDQYYDMVARRGPQDGETRLLFAVLEDAIRCYAIAKNSTTGFHRREFEEVQRWVNTRGDHDIFAFDSICAVFSIQPEALRNQLNSLRIENFPSRRL